MSGDILMTSAKGHAELSDSPRFPAEMIRRFLLGSLNAAEQPVFEQRLLLDDDLAARVRLAEFELADDYAYERLSEAEKDLFKENFRLSADRDRQVRVSRSLRDRFAPVPASSGSAVAVYLKTLRPIFSFRRPVWRIAFAAAMFLLLLGTVWVAVKKEARIKEAITRQIRRHRSPNPSLPVESNHPEGNSTPEHQTASPPMPIHEPTPATGRAVIGVVVILKLSEGSVPTAGLPTGTDDFVGLRIDLKANQPGPFRGELLTGDGQNVLGAESIKVSNVSDTQIDFEIPAPLLKPGNYQFRLVRDNAGTEENMGSYYFQIQ
jgi:hypothetical protein